MDFIQENFIIWNQLAAGGIVACIPGIIFVLIFQKYIIEGLTKGSLKK